jgi:glycolate oxidase FAD binding subunit
MEHSQVNPETLRAEPVDLSSARAQIARKVAQAAESKTPLRLIGGGTHASLAASSSGEPLDLSGLSGVIAYEPSELVITVGAATPLAAVQAELAAQQQMLAFEPLLGAGRSTVGGGVAAQRGGPRRWLAGAVRDHVLGLRLIDGQGQELNFGGQVIKNVAGFDVTRLQAGAWGSLGVITEVSFKVLPMPQQERTLQFEMKQAQAIQEINRWAGKPLPLSGSSWDQGVLRVRLSGVSAAIELACQTMGGERLPERAAHYHWESLRERSHPFFDAGGALWRLSLPPTIAPLDLPGATLWEWGGGQRWLRSEAPADFIRKQVAAWGGHAFLMHGPDTSAPIFHPLSPVLRSLHLNLKKTFDPFGIMNPGTPDFF